MSYSHHHSSCEDARSSSTQHERPAYRCTTKMRMKHRAHKRKDSNGNRDPPGRVPLCLATTKVFKSGDKGLGYYRDLGESSPPATVDLPESTGLSYPYRCWPGLAKVLVAGGAKYCPSTSAQLESLFTGLTRQQGASRTAICNSVTCNV